jgi:hypothetical protein
MDSITIPITEREQQVLMDAQRVLASALAEMARQVERAQPGGAVPILAAIQAGVGTVVAHLEVAPAGPCSLELVMGTKRYPLGMLVGTPET